MKKLKTAITLLFFACLVVFTFLCRKNQQPRQHVELIPQTQLFLFSKTENKCGESFCYYRLIQKDGMSVTDWILDKQGNPFTECRGLVFIGEHRKQMELFDCRGQQKKPVLTKNDLDKLDCYLVNMRPRYDDKNIVIIFLNKRNINGFLGKMRYEYNLQTKELSPLIYS